jgi:hypothetical protein
MCESKELIVGYVYDELSPGERAEFEAHLAGCARCEIEIQELRSTRTHLTLWAPPEPDLGFRVIRGGAAPAPALPRRSRFVPAFAFAAAAVIVLAVAAAIANVEVRYGGDGMVVRTGWSASRSTATGAPADVAPDARVVSVQPQAPAADFAALDRRLREIELALGDATAGGGVQVASAARMSDAEILRRVRQIVGEAEARQETAVAQRLLAVVRDFDLQRRTDLALIQQGIGQFQGLTNTEIAQNRDMLNQLVRAASTRQER